MPTSDLPEIWNPSQTPRKLTLFDEPEDAPCVMAMCAPRMWDGFYVPILTLPYLAFYWGQCQANDPNGEWFNTTPYWRGGGLDMRMVISWAGGDGEEVYEPINPNPLYSQTSNSARFEVDRLPWRDA